jgi:hypothetical protein
VRCASAGAERPKCADPAYVVIPQEKTNKKTGRPLEPRKKKEMRLDRFFFPGKDLPGAFAGTGASRRRPPRMRPEAQRPHRRPAAKANIACGRAARTAHQRRRIRLRLATGTRRAFHEN